MNSKSRKLLFGLYLIALAGAGLFAFTRLRPKRASLEFAKIDLAALNERSVVRAAEKTGGVLVPDTPEQWHAYLSVAEVKLLMPALEGGLVNRYDPWEYLVGPAGRRDWGPWEEHPTGRVNADTNSLGLRGRWELPDELSDLRVLVAGDSHTFGVCRAVEVFPAVLQGALLQQNPGKTVEVLNAGYGGYTFYNYVGTLLHWRHRAPQVLVVAVFGGNDFFEALPFAHFFAGTEMAGWTPEQLALRGRALEAGPNAMGQGLHSAYGFQCMPAEADIALDAGISTLSEIRAIGEQIGTQLVVCFIPNACAQEFDPPVPEIEAVRAILGEAGFSLDAQTALEERFVERVRAEGFECVDMRPIFAAEPTPPYWRRDQHTSVRGHALIAQVLEPIVSRLLKR